MKALILAAGIGSRLAPLTHELPKSLVPVNGMPIIFKQIENLHQNGIIDISIVTGYRADLLKNAVKEKYSNVQFIDNVDYLDTNNMYSAYLARDLFSGIPFLMMNADVFYDASVVRALLRYPAECAIVTDIGNYLDESMKVIEKGGRLVKISKAITKEEALGASIDVYKFSADAGSLFFDVCKIYIEEKKELKLWSEVALNEILRKTIFKACPLDGRWMEIDNHDDLKVAEAMFKE